MPRPFHPMPGILPPGPNLALRTAVLVLDAEARERLGPDGSTVGIGRRSMGVSRLRLSDEPDRDLADAALRVMDWSRTASEAVDAVDRAMDGIEAIALPRMAPETMPRGLDPARRALDDVVAGIDEAAASVRLALWHALGPTIRARRARDLVDALAAARGDVGRAGTASEARSSLRAWRNAAALMRDFAGLLPEEFRAAGHDPADLDVEPVPARASAVASA